MVANHRLRRKAVLVGLFQNNLSIERRRQFADDALLDRGGVVWSHDAKEKWHWFASERRDNVRDESGEMKNLPRLPCSIDDVRRRVSELAKRTNNHKS